MTKLPPAYHAHLLPSLTEPTESQKPNLRGKTQMEPEPMAGTPYLPNPDCLEGCPACQALPPH